MKKVLSGLYGAVVALLVTVIYDPLLKDVARWPKSAALTGAIMAGIVLLILYELVGGAKSVARHLSPICKVAGAWQINLTNNKDRPLSVCKIHFSLRDYVYMGYGINRDGSLGSDWSSRDVHYDEQQDELSFTSDATILGSGERVRNYGYIKFVKSASGKFEYGTGYFVDMANDLKQTHMTFTRLDDGDFDRAVKSALAKTRDAADKMAQPILSAPPARRRRAHRPTNGGDASIHRQASG